MNNFIYEKLAVTNLKNNRKTYVPYIFTGVLTVMMFYIIDALSKRERYYTGYIKDMSAVCNGCDCCICSDFSVLYK